MKPAKIYLRRNGSFGSSCDGCQDTGHHITSDDGEHFVVWAVDDTNRQIAHRVSREEAERAIETDWRASK